MTALRWIGIVGGLLFAFGGTPVAAQSSADAFFHEAAQRYVAGERAAARRAVERGLKVAPSDPRLQALREKLRQQNKKRGGQSSRQGGRRQRPPSKKRTARKQQSNSSGRKRPQADPPSDRRSSSRSRRSRKNAQPRSPQERQDGARRNTALSRTQAARILRTLENQELKLLRELQVRAQNAKRVEKDW